MEHEMKRAKGIYSILRREQEAKALANEVLDEILRRAKRRCPTEKVRVDEDAVGKFSSQLYGEGFVRNTVQAFTSYEFLSCQPNTGIEFDWQDKPIIRWEEKRRVQFAHGVIEVRVYSKAFVPEVRYNMPMSLVTLKFRCVGCGANLNEEGYFTVTYNERGEMPTDVETFMDWLVPKYVPCFCPECRSHD